MNTTIQIQTPGSRCCWRGCGGSSLPPPSCGWTAADPGGHSRTFLEDAAAAAARGGGVVSDHTARTLEDFTHQGMFQYFEETWGLARSFFTTDASDEVLNCNGAFSAGEPGRRGKR